MAELEKAYDPKKVEERLTDAWQKAGLFKPRREAGKKPFTIVIPPPNITGALHVGHALNDTLQDVLIRYNNMCGRSSFWVPGLDHGGIATQNVIEKKLSKEQKLTRYDLGREKFVELIWGWYKECGADIYQQFKKMGWALDLSPENIRFTMDKERAAAVFECFKQWWDKKYIYRGKRLINWCVRCSTALSDIEVEHETKSGFLYHIHYPMPDGSKGVVIATTRPETMFADVAVAVNPKDERYKDILGKQVVLPLTGCTIPVIADEDVAIDFGTGALKITPAHDIVDYKIGQKHALEMISVISDKGKLINVPEAYLGMDRDAARKKVAEDLNEQGFMVKEEKYVNAVSSCYRCGSAIEPYLSEQWFVKMKDLAAPAIQAAEKGDVRFHPESWKKPFVNWLSNIEDWCISRQIWWGHRIPVWYCAKCSAPGLTFTANKQGDMELSKVSFEDGAKPILSFDKPGKCPDCGGSDLVQDPDVLDTWFSSALWPISVFDWPQETEDLKYFYPTTTLVTGYEIFYLWVARMVITGLEFKGEAPFKDVFLNGIVRDKKGKKMSKSLGNVVDPLELTAKYGTDAVRFALLLQALPGKDIPFGEESVVGPRNFCNKIYNASRFILMNLGDVKKVGPLPSRNPKDYKELADAWIVARFNIVAYETHDYLKEYDIGGAADALYHFLWGDFCDWYVELAKTRFETEREHVLTILINILYGTLKLLHPFMPFITDEIAAVLRPILGKEGEFLYTEDYPQPDGNMSSGNLKVYDMQYIQGVITSIRAVRSRFNISPAAKIKIKLTSVAENIRELMKRHLDYILYFTKAELDENILAKIDKPVKSAAAVYGGTVSYVLLDGMVDFEKERARLAKDIEKARELMDNRAARLADEKFINSAPKEQIDKTRAEYEEAERMVKEYSLSLGDLGIE